MAKIKVAKWTTEDTRYIFFCPGCNENHACKATLWSFNGDFEKPTLAPSVHLIVKHKKGSYVCHSFVKEGKIQYLEDSTHKLAGKTVKLPEIK